MNGSLPQVCFNKQCERQDVFYVDDDDDNNDHSTQRMKRPSKKTPKSDVKWTDEPIGVSTDRSKTYYHSVEINGCRIDVGDFFLVRSDDPFTPGTGLYKF